LRIKQDHFLFFQYRYHFDQHFLTIESALPFCIQESAIEYNHIIRIHIILPCCSHHVYRKRRRIHRNLDFSALEFISRVANADDAVAKNRDLTTGSSFTESQDEFHSNDTWYRASEAFPEVMTHFQLKFR
jgi:hypothetical protein